MVKESLYERVNKETLLECLNEQMGFSLADKFLVTKAIDEIIQKHHDLTGKPLEFLGDVQILSVIEQLKHFGFFFPRTEQNEKIAVNKGLNIFLRDLAKKQQWGKYNKLKDYLRNSRLIKSKR